MPADTQDGYKRILPRKRCAKLGCTEYTRKRGASTRYCTEHGIEAREKGSRAAHIRQRDGWRMLKRLAEFLGCEPLEVEDRIRAFPPSIAPEASPPALAKLEKLLRFPETEQEVEATEPETSAERALELLCAVRESEVVTVKVETLRALKALLDARQPEASPPAAGPLRVVEGGVIQEHGGEVYIVGADRQPEPAQQHAELRERIATWHKRARGAWVGGAVWEADALLRDCLAALEGK